MVVGDRGGYTSIHRILHDLVMYRLLKKIDQPAMTFTVYFMGYEDAADIPQDEGDRGEWALSRRATLELTQYGPHAGFSMPQLTYTRLN